MLVCYQELLPLLDSPTLKPLKGKYVHPTGKFAQILTLMHMDL